MNFEQLVMDGIKDLGEKLDNFIAKTNDDTLKRQEEHGKEHGKIWAELGKLQLKSGFWGTIGGLLIVLSAVAVALITGLFK